MDETRASSVNRDDNPRMPRVDLSDDQRDAVALLTQKANDTFGSQTKARRWLDRPTTALAGASPIEAALGGDTEEVLKLLGRIDHGLAV